MKVPNLLPLAAVSTAFVLPPEQVFQELKIEDHHGHTQVERWLEKATSIKDEVVAGLKKDFEEMTEITKDAWEEISKSSKSLLDEALEKGEATAESLGQAVQDKAGDFSSYIEESDWLNALDGGHHRPGHGKPHHPPHHEPNHTIYELIAESKYTTKLAKLISEYDDLVEALNSTSANFTVFAPTDKAFEKIPKHAPKPSKEQLKAILSYHVVPDVLPAGKVLVTHTAPTLLKGEHLSSQPEPQRIAFKLGLRGLTVNFYSRVVAINIFATNGVIHGVDSLILPPPNAITLVDLFPGEFSTLELGLGKTGLLEKLNTTAHNGGTLFAPSNFAFQKLGPKINAFLFSQYGQKYLKALLEYHVVYGNTLYSDAYYKASGNDAVEGLSSGQFHVDLPTLLKDRSLSVDIVQYGGFISMKINGFATVSVKDVVAEDGVVQVVSSVLIPPKKIGGSEEHWTGGGLTVEELQSRLEPFVPKTDL